MTECNQCYDTGWVGTVSSDGEYYREGCAACQPQEEKDMDYFILNTGRGCNEWTETRTYKSLTGAKRSAVKALKSCPNFTHVRIQNADRETVALVRREGELLCWDPFADSGSGS